MGNMIFNQRVQDDISQKHVEHRIFPEHMYKGPLGLGDPDYRGLSKMEEDPLIPQRMRDAARTNLCREYVEKFEDCGKNAGISLIYKCQAPKDELVKCVEGWFYDPDFKAAIIEEYLNERSHFRQTGIKTKRYKRGAYVGRDLDTDPALDANGKYRLRKPTGWDESYPDGPPKWANYKYD